MCKAALALFKVKEKKVGTEETILGDGKGNILWLKLECVGELALITQYKVGFGGVGWVIEEGMRSV